jgi:hypothetical protein
MRLREGPIDLSYPPPGPNDRQAAFHKIEAIPTEADPAGSTLIKLANGGLGSGKSTGCEREHAELCCTFDKGQSLIIRKSTRGRSDMSCIPDFRRMLEPKGIARYYPSNDCFRFYNGHESWVAPGDDWQRFGSIDITHFFAQEAHEIKDGNVLPTLSARLRHPAGRRDGRHYYRGLLDARGVDNKHWLTQDFIRHAWNYDTGRERRAQSDNPNWVYMRFRTSDNAQNLVPNYEGRLRHEYRSNEAWIKVFIDGAIGMSVEGRPVFAGAFDRDRHVATTITEDPTVPLLRGWDFGFRCPAVTWSQYTRAGRLLVLRELVPTNISIHDLIREVKSFQANEFPRRRESGYHDYGDVAGDQINSSGARDIEAVEQAFNTEVIGRKGDIKPGLDDIRRLMNDGVNVGGKNVSRFGVDESCEMLISALLGSYYFEHERREDPIKGTSYAGVVDSLRYVAQQVVEESPLEEFDRSRIGVTVGNFGRIRYG